MGDPGEELDQEQDVRDPTGVLRLLQQHWREELPELPPLTSHEVIDA